MKSNLKQKVFSLSSMILLSGSLLTAATSCGSTTSNFFTVKTDSGLEVEFCDKGASVYSLKFNNQYITYHPKDKNTFLKNNNYYGKSLGRVAGRIKDGKFKIGDTQYEVERNEVKTDTYNNKNNTLHGGTNGFTSKNFKRYVQELTDRYTIAFNYVSAAGECGFPETVDAWFVYTLYKSTPQMDINIIGVPSGETPLNMTTHPYVNLGYSDKDDVGIKDHLLTIPTDTMAKFNVADKNQIVVGTEKVADVSQGGKTPFDFSTAKKIGADIAEAKAYDACSGGYDHIWVSSDKSKPLATEDNPIVLQNEAKGLKLSVTSDANALILYTNCWPNESMEMNPKGKDSQYAGLTIEPITYFEYKEDGSIDKDILCTPDKPFQRQITYKFEKTN